MFEIETGIPIPEGRASYDSKYSFGAMPVGGSFKVPSDKRYSVYEAARKYRTRHPGWAFKMARADGGWRIWRIS
jgi:hypothetical protein